MPLQTNIQQTILNGSYSLMQLTNNNLNLVMSGAEATRQAFIQWFRLNLQALQDQYNIADYTSATTTTLYDRINQFVGIPYGATVDPNFQAPGVKISAVNLSNYNSGQIFFSNASPVTISNYNTTLYQLYGNNPELAIYLGTGSP